MRVSLHSHNTPLEPFNVGTQLLGGNESLCSSLNMFIKRDDLTGFTFSGNKIRKLEYLLGEAKRRGCDTIVSYGKKQSNWCRATVAACTYLGLEIHLVLNCDDDCQFGMFISGLYCLCKATTTHICILYKSIIIIPSINKNISKHIFCFQNRTLNWL